VVYLLIWWYIYQLGGISTDLAVYLPTWWYIYRLGGIFTNLAVYLPTWWYIYQLGGIFIYQLLNFKRLKLMNVAQQIFVFSF